jgi:hypothetical protein
MAGWDRWDKKGCPLQDSPFFRIYPNFMEFDGLPFKLGQQGSRLLASADCSNRLLVSDQLAVQSRENVANDGAEQ